jgi:starch phosphorylase
LGKQVVNVTNGVDHRRFLDPAFGALYTKYLGSDKWRGCFSLIARLENELHNQHFRAQWKSIKRQAKEKASYFIEQRTGILVSPDSLFDVHVKRIHEYKRQLLNILHILSCYLDIKEQGIRADSHSRTYIFGGKAAPGYFRAKQIIELINAVSRYIDADLEVRDHLKVVFVPNYNVSAAEILIPACDVSEQISTAGTEASGTGNMKFAINGAVTVGTYDGANIEILERVGMDSFYLFGKKEHELSLIKENYRPSDFLCLPEYRSLAKVLGFIKSGVLTPHDPYRFCDLANAIMDWDSYFTVVDFPAYKEIQRKVETDFSDSEKWLTVAITNALRSSHFSSDRAVEEYCENVWFSRCTR